MTTLHDRLADLADDLPLTAPPPGLWRAGERRARRRRLATAAGVVVVAAAVGLGTSAAVSSEQSDAPVVGSPHRTVLPDTFFNPSGRLPVADGGTGPLVAVIPAERRSWLRSEPGLVGVSAEDQTYAFLDLPGWIGCSGYGDSWSLAPNGRWVAYWYGTPQADCATGVASAAGIAVLDTSTGAVRRQALGGELGVQPQAALGWAGDTVYFDEVDYVSLDVDRGESSARRVATFEWDLAQDAPHQVADPHGLVGRVMGPAGMDGFLSGPVRSRWYVVHSAEDLAGEPVARFATPGEVDPFGAALSPDQASVAVLVTGDGGNTGHVVVGPVLGGATQLTQLTQLAADVDPYRLLGWLDDDTIVMEQWSDSTLELVAVDQMTGRSRTLSTFDRPDNSVAQFASDLLRSPVVDAVEPPHPRNPVAVAGFVGLLAAALLSVALAVRRRRARR